jgi:FKBP-type peptidyl-prolyl cis-trans isomerase FkpA
MRKWTISGRLGLMLGWAFLAACQQSADTTKNDAMTELVIRDLTAGNGRAAAPGMTAVVHYTGWLYAPDVIDNRGTKFDSSVDRGETFSFDLGAQQVIKGWDDGVVGMKIGGRRELIIPPELAYGSRGAGGVIPPDATLVFEVELVDLQ